MASTSIVIAVSLFLLASKTTALDEGKSSVDVTRLKFSTVEEGIIQEVNSEEQYGITTAACDCGPNSKGCKIENGTKICDCEYHYRQENGTCIAWCDRLWSCENGGVCVNESCECLPGTRGGFCKTVDACEGIKGPLLCGDPDGAYCDFDEETRKPYCHCSTMYYKYYPKIRGCVECDCGDFGSCTLVDGKKVCKCNKGAAVKKVEYWGDTVDRCVECDCGNNSIGCSFDGYKQVCNCKKGFAQQPDLYGDACNECSCGPHGQCYFIGWYQYCNCDKGYSPSVNINRTELTCEACDCGTNGKCSFKEEVKQCKCNPGYALRDGICTACQCYVGNETAPCTFINKIQKCFCPEGYEPTKFFCKDIDECLNSSNSCPLATTNCVNTEGSYKCVCKEGYAPKRAGYDPKTYGCDDIDECEDENMCPRNNTLCHNLPGSYSCTCQYGYVPVPPNLSPKDAGCEKKTNKVVDDDSLSWKTGLIVVGVILCLTIIGIQTVNCMKQRHRRSPLKAESTLQEMS